MRALWLAAPSALTRYAGVLVAVVVAAGLAAGAAASNPFVRAGVKSSSLRGEVASMSPYAAGLSVVSRANDVSGDTARRAAALRFGRRLAFAGEPVLTSRFYAQVAGANGNALTVVVMARTDATAHVDPLSGSGDGVWVSRAAAQTADLRAGETLRLTEFVTSDEKAPEADVRIARIYQSLETRLEDPYWANLVQDIRPPTLDSSAPPSYVFVSPRELLRLAHALRIDQVDNQFEFPVDVTKLRYVGATGLQRRYTTLGDELRQANTRIGAPLGCGRVLYDSKPSCTVSSSLEAALLIASNDVSDLSATIWLLSACALGIALLVGAAAGVFLVRRRSDEAHLLFARGERTSLFALRVGVETLVPAIVGGAIGLGVAYLALTAFAPAGTLDGGTAWTGVRDAAVATLATVALIAVTAAASFPRRSDASHPLLRRLARVPWEAIVLAGAFSVLGLLLAGGGLAHSSNGDVHPSLAVFLLPALAAAGIAGLSARIVRRAVRGRGDRSPLPVFLAARRLAAARALLIAVIVAATTALSVFAYATTLSSSVSRAIAEKAYVSNGSDVQGVVDPSNQIYDRFPFPAAIVEIDTTNAFTADGRQVDIVAGDPAELADVIRWGPWSDDPRPMLPRLARPAPRGVLPAIASPNMPRVDVIVDQGARVPIVVVARRPFPGMNAGRPALLVSRTTLKAVARARGFVDPGFGADGVIWAKGDPRRIEPTLRLSNIRPAFFTTFSHIRADPSVRAGKRSYGYLRAIGGGAVVLALLALVLYLQARQRGQVVASALVRRMGASRRVDAGAVALEAVAVTLLAFVVGAVVAVAAARLVTPHLDPLPQYAPGTALSIPWAQLLVVGAGTTVVAALLAACAVGLALRSDASEAIRVA